MGLALAADPDPPAEPPFDWYAIPVAGADTDDGAGGGARAEIARVEEGYAPYKWAWMVHAYVTTTGYQHHRVRFDRVGIGPRNRLHVYLFCLRVAQCGSRAPRVARLEMQRGFVGARGSFLPPPKAIRNPGSLPDSA